jgi:PTH1 family peptidyl-tRNA hydrolase
MNILQKILSFLLPSSANTEEKTGHEEPATMKYLIVGLGNIGNEYDGTRHNVGFRVVDALAEAQGATFQDKRYGFICKTRVKNAELLLLKPSTYMNLSGNAVRYWMQQEKIPVENVLIIVDDLSLPVGAIRIKQNGSDAGHNGLKHIAQMLSTQNYNRLKFGIGNDFPRGGQVDFVLGKFSPEDNKAINEKVPVACDAIKAFALSGMQFAMCHYNNK